MHTQAKVAVALVWPLHAAIASSYKDAHALKISELLGELPDWMVARFKTLEQVVATRVSASCALETCCSHDCMEECDSVNLQSRLQEVFLHLQYIRTEKLRANIAESFSENASMRKLLDILRQALGGDADRGKDGDCMFTELAQIQRLDVSVNEADQKYFAKYTVPPLQLCRLPGTTAEGVSITTYAALVIIILAHVGYMLARRLSPVMPCSWPGEPDTTFLKEACDACPLAIVRLLLCAICGFVLTSATRSAAWPSGEAWPSGDTGRCSGLQALY